MIVHPKKELNRAVVIGSDLVHIVPDGVKSYYGQDRITVNYITGTDGFHCNPEGAGYDFTCKQCIAKAKEKYR